eukprot:CAMPEP_0204840778 /NCGR_PEP_ID=MMETSP1346-20131115/38956_1 /ASSEMBLY_ACC=CAM_ASM_000771 /TAXON_ID=215587 /ORGANISM="Aplanochytrium stocchinoi, Strain GSBS06" /LENGTH=564 /DNA_ID=CAMNT_0051978389 /DNA_START=18 /DNA_END=1712 /DNA_ORIENTATION=+
MFKYVNVLATAFVLAVFELPCTNATSAPTSSKLSGTVELCAERVRPGLGAVTQVDRANSATQIWVPTTGSNFNVNIDFDAGTAQVFGQLFPVGGDKVADRLEFNATLSMQTGIDDCYCSQPFIAGPPSNTKYKNVNRCGPIAYSERKPAYKDLLLCPHCQKGQCFRADTSVRKHVSGIPKPIYSDWVFYETVDGSIGGPGLEKYRSQIRQTFKMVPDTIDSCTIDTTNLPVPQLYCTDFDIPENGYGFGVNGFNQKCGLSFWYNCAEDRPFLPPKNKDVKVHEADLNVNLVTCTAAPTPTPTCGPTAFFEAELVNNNLGGFCGGDSPTKAFIEGEDCGDGSMTPQEIRYRVSDNIYLVVTNTSEYTPGIGIGGGLNNEGALNNGLVDNGKFGQINLRHGTSVDLNFAFVNGGGSPVVIDELSWRFFDLDQSICPCNFTTCPVGIGGDEPINYCSNCDAEFPREQLRIPMSEVDVVTLSDGLIPPVDSRICQYQDMTSFLFNSRAVGNGDDNPTDPENLDDFQKSLLVDLTYTDVSNFNASYCIINGAGTVGRNIIFAFNFSECV